MAADRKARTVVFKTLEEVSLGNIKNAIEKEIAEGSLVVLQELRPHEYLAEFKEKDQAESLTEIGFDLTTTHVDCHPPKGYYTNVSLMGLRAYIEDEEITSVLERYGEIKGPIVRLKCKSGHDLAGLENGNRLVKMVLNKPSIPYSLKIDGEWCRIIHSGQQPYCSTCDEFGHNRRNCKEIECHKCKEKGHIAIDCTDIHLDDNDETQQNNSQRDQPNLEPNNSNEQSEGSETQGAKDETLDQTLQKEASKMETNENEPTRQQNLKRPHATTTDTNTDSEDGFQVVTNRRSKQKPPPKLPATSKTMTDKTRPNGRQIKPPTIINKRNIHSDK